MKFKKIILVMLILLAVISIGAVSAADLTEAQTPIEFSEDNQIITADDDLDDENTYGEIYDDEDDENPDDEIDDEDSEEDYDDDKDDEYDGEILNSSMTIEFDEDNDYKLNNEIWIWVSLPDDATGELTLYIDDEEWTTDEVYGGTRDYFYYSMNHFGTTTFTVEYSGSNKYAPAEQSLSYVLNNTQYSIDIAEEIAYGQKEVKIDLPYGLNGDVKVVYNGKRYTAKRVYDEYGDYEYCCFDGSDLNYGENRITVSYEGDETFGKYSETKFINVKSIINYDDRITFGDKALVSILLPTDATGTLKVYTSEEDDDSGEYIENIIQSTNIKNGVGKILISNLPVGYNHFEAKYEGNYEEIYDSITVTVEPKIEGPYRFLKGSDGYITVTCQDDITETLSVDDNGEYTVWEFENGVVKIPLCNLKEGYHSFDFSLGEIYESYGDYILYVCNSTDFNFDIEADFDDVLINSSDERIEISLPDYLNGNITSLIDGKVIETINLDEYSYYYMTLDVNGFDYGTHNLEVKYTSDFFKNKTFNKTFDIVPAVIYIPSEMRFNEYHVWTEHRNYIDYITISLQDDATGTITVLVNGKVFETIQTDSSNDGFYTSSLYNLTLNEYDVSVIYSGDAKYPKFTKNNHVNLTYDFYIYASSYDSTTLTVGLPNQIMNGELKITIDGKEYSWIPKVDSYDCDVICNISDLKLGNHKVVVSYSGDEKFYPLTVTENITLLRYIDFDYDDLYVGDKKEISLVMPDDAKGMLSVRLFQIDDEEEEIEYESENISFVNNKASYVISDLPVGHYKLYAHYTGNDYEVCEEECDFNVKAFKIDYPYGINDNITVSINLNEKSKGNLVVTLYDVSQEDEGIVIDSKSIALKDGKADYTYFGLKFIDYKLDVKYEEDGDEIYSDTRYISLDDDLEVEISDDIIYDNPIEFRVDLPNDATGNITVYVIEVSDYEFDEDDFEDFEILINKTFTVSGPLNAQLPKLKVDKYKIKAVYEGNYGKAESYYVNFDIIAKVEIPEKLSADKENVVNFEYVNGTGNLIVLWNEKTLTNTTLTDGKARIVLPDITKPGYNVLELDYYENGKEKYSLYESYLINPANITVDTNNPAAGEDLVLDITIPKFFAGDVTAVLEDNTYNSTMDNGIAKVIIPDLNTGEYDISINYNSKNYQYSDTCKMIKVTISDTPKETPIIRINCEDNVVEGSDLTVEVSIEKATGSVLINSEKVILTNGKASATITNVSIGNLLITVEYSGDDKYKKGSAEKTVAVYEKQDANLKASVKNIIVGEDATITITVNKEITGKVTADGSEVAITNGKGKYTIKKPAVGNYSVSLEFAGDKNFKATEISVVFSVTKAEISSDNIKIEKVASSDNNITSFKITLPSDATGTVTLNINNVNYNADVKKGAAIINADKLPAGNYNVNITYSGDDKYSPITVSKTVAVNPTATIINAAGITTTYATSKNIIVTLKDINNNVLKDKKVVLVINGVSKTIVTDAKGQVILAIGTKLAPKIYNAKFTFAGDENYAKSTGSAKIIVKKATPIITAKKKTFKKAKKVKEYSITLKVNGKALKKMKVTIKVGKKKFTAKTKNNGKATFKLKKLNKKAKYNAIITYNGNSYYNKVTNKVKITIK